MRIDAHQHFWHYSPEAFEWIEPGSVLAEDHGPVALRCLLDASGIDGTIVVQARQSEAETDLLLSLAEAHSWILGVVGWIDLRAEDVADRLAARASQRKLVGYRHIVQDEPEDDFLLKPDFVRGVRAVLAHGRAFDILVKPRQTAFVAPFLDAVGPGRLILDHGGKPDIRASAWDLWATDIAAMARTPSLFCKISGLVTEADHAHWRHEEIERYLDHLLACFGPQRLIFCSDWPVCKLAADYGRVVDLAWHFVARACPDHREDIFARNAVRAYSLASSDVAAIAP